MFDKSLTIGKTIINAVITKTIMQATNINDVITSTFLKEITVMHILLRIKIMIVGNIIFWGQICCKPTVIFQATPSAHIKGRTKPKIIIISGTCQLPPFIIRSNCLNYLTPRATDWSDLNNTNGATAALISNGSTTPVCSATHQYSGTAMMVSRIAVTDGTSFWMVSWLDHQTHFGLDIERPNHLVLSMVVLFHAHPGSQAQTVPGLRLGNWHQVA
jgi:hypothetical protein